MAAKNLKAEAKLLRLFSFLNSDLRYKEGDKESLNNLNQILTGHY